MSNLRSDCREIAERLPAGDLYRAHLLCCCAQIDQIEDQWHAAERRARDAEYKVALWESCPSFVARRWRSRDCRRLLKELTPYLTQEERMEFERRLSGGTGLDAGHEHA